jgi:hypothetical protein
MDVRKSQQIQCLEGCQSRGQNHVGDMLTPNLLNLRQIVSA